MVFFSQGVRRWKGVSEEGGREWESCFNELSPGSEGGHLQRLEEEGARRESASARRAKELPGGGSPELSCLKGTTEKANE